MLWAPFWNPVSILLYVHGFNGEKAIIFRSQSLYAQDCLVVCATPPPLRGPGVYWLLG